MDTDKSDLVVPSLTAESLAQAGLLSELRMRAAIVAHRFASGMTEQARRDEAELLGITRALDEHPDDYDGPCECQTCLSYD